MVAAGIGCRLEHFRKIRGSHAFNVFIYLDNPR
jgi:hypothetical protein